MVMARNRSVLGLLLVAACLAPPAIARQQRSPWLAQAPENPDAVTPTTPDAEAAPDRPDTAEPPAVPTGAAPSEPTPQFNLPEQLPADTTLEIAYSASMEVITNALVQRFESQFANASVMRTPQPSDAALEALLAGTADLAAIGRGLTEAERDQGLTSVTVSREKIAIIVGSNNPFNGDLEAEDFVRIFRGEMTNWQALAPPGEGPDLPIRLVDRPATSDTRRALGDYEIFGGDLTTGDNAEQVTADSTADIVEALGDNGISYAIASQVEDQDNVRVLTMHGTLPSDPRYPYSQPRNYVYRDATSLPAEVEAFLAFATNPDGRAAIAAAKTAEAADVAAADLPDGVIAVRPNGQGYVTGDRTGNLNFWNADGTSSGDPVPAHMGPVTALSFDTAGQRLISGGADGELRFWDAVGNPVGDPINGSGSPITSLVVQPDGSFITAEANGNLQRWNNQGTPVGALINNPEGKIYDIALSPDGQTLISASADGTLRRWNVADGAALGDPLMGHQGAVRAIAMRSDGSFVSGGAEGTVRRWDASGAPVGDPTSVPGAVTAIAVQPEGGQLAVGLETGALQLLNADGTAAADPVTDIGGAVDDVAYMPTLGQIVVSTGGVPQLRDPSGQLIPPSLPAVDASEESTRPPSPLSGLPPELQDLWEQVQQLPPRVLWIIPIALLALLLLALLRSFQSDKEELEEDAIAPAEEEDTVDFSAAPDDLEADFTTDHGATDSPSSRGPVAGISPEQASASLDANLVRAKQALSEGTALEQAGRHQEALDRYNQAIEAADVERLKAVAAGVGFIGAGALIARGLARRGSALAHLRRPDEGLKSFNRALEMDPEDIAAWTGKGIVMTQLGQLDAALFCFDKAIELDPNRPDAWNGKGAALQKLGREAEARTCFTRARTLEGAPESESRPASPPRPASERSAAVDRPDQAVAPALDRPSTERRSVDVPDAPPSSVEPSPPEADEDIPPELRRAIATLPETPDLPSPQARRAPPITVPPEVEAITLAADAGDTDVPSELLADIENLPAEADQPDPQAPAIAPIDVPSDVSEILTGQSPIPSGEETVDLSTPSPPPVPEPAIAGSPPLPPAPPAPAADGPSPTVAMPVSPPIKSTQAPESAAIPDQPEAELGYDPGLADLPPEVLAALQGIPEDSPDHFDLPPTPAPAPKRASPPPPPPPSNPRLKRPQSGNESQS